MTSWTDVGEVLASGRAWTVACADAADVLSELGPASVDHAILDAPYDPRTHAGHRHVANVIAAGQSTTRSHANYQGSSSADPRERQSLSAASLANPIDFAPIEAADVVRLVLPVASRWVVAFCALEELGAYRLAAGPAWIRSGVWIRDSGPQLSGDRPAQGAEGVAIMHRPGKKRWNGGGTSARWVGDAPRGDERPDHPTPKPLSVLMDMVRRFTDPGDVVLDPFAGSGTTGVACLLTGRRFIGVEIDPRYHAIAVQRLEQAALDARGGALFTQTQTSLF
jgi:site-specific DNA-methyltransferase (adenine-specific)